MSAKHALVLLAGCVADCQHTHPHPSTRTDTHLARDLCLNDSLLRLPRLQLLPQQLHLLVSLAQGRLLRKDLVRLRPAAGWTGGQTATCWVHKTLCVAAATHGPALQLYKHSALQACNQQQCHRSTNKWEIDFEPNSLECGLQLCQLLLVPRHLGLELRCCGGVRLCAPQLVAQLGSKQVNQV